MLELIYISIFATLFATILVAALRPLAIYLKLVDRPNSRKVHKGDIPLVRRAGHISCCLNWRSCLYKEPALERFVRSHYASHTRCN